MQNVIDTFELCKEPFGKVVSSYSECCRIGLYFMVVDLLNKKEGKWGTYVCVGNKNRKIFGNLSLFDN